MLAANQPLSTVYLLKDALKDIWYAHSVWEGWKRWRAWQRLVMESGLQPLMRFARNLRKYLRGILVSARFAMHTSLLEGVNNKIKVIKRMAYGFRDTAYFFLKTKAAFPGKPWRTKKKGPENIRALQVGGGTRNRTRVRHLNDSPSASLQSQIWIIWPFPWTSVRTGATPESRFRGLKLATNRRSTLRLLGPNQPAMHLH